MTHKDMIIFFVVIAGSFIGSTFGAYMYNDYTCNQFFIEEVK